MTSAQTQATGRRAGCRWPSSQCSSAVWSPSRASRAPRAGRSQTGCPGRTCRGPTLPSVARALLLAGLVLLNIATGNVIVRLALLAIGALRSDQVAARAPPRATSSQPTGSRVDACSARWSGSSSSGWLAGERRRQHRHRRQGPAAVPRDPGGGCTFLADELTGRHRRRHGVLPRRQLRQPGSSPSAHSPSPADSWPSPPRRVQSAARPPSADGELARRGLHTRRRASPAAYDGIVSRTGPWPCRWCRARRWGVVDDARTLGRGG